MAGPTATGETEILQINLPQEPLFFTPIYKETLWGGATLHTRMGRPLPECRKIAESWELSGLQTDRSVVAAGPLKGTSISTLFAQFPQELIGNAGPFPAFPLLYKFIDAADRLSVQVHPDDSQAKANGWGDFGKTECWYVIDCKKDARCIVGFNRDLTPVELAGAVADASLNNLLAYIPIKPGDLLFIPAGTVHALMEGTLVYEVQQTSNTTFRLYDWARVDSSGRPRELHTGNAFSVVDTLARNHRPLPEITLEAGGVRHSIRTACSHFALEQYSFERDGRAVIPARRSFRVLTSVAGNCELHHHGETLTLPLGTTTLLPAVMDDVQAEGSPGTNLLVSWIPDLKNDIISPLKAAGISDRQIRELGGYGFQNDITQLM